MKLRYITMSDPRENLSIEDTIKLLQISPLAELGIQAHPSAMTFGMPRNIWMNNLLDNIENLHQQPNLALHINYEWCDDMTHGLIPQEISKWLGRKNTKTNKPLIHRIQLNIGDGTNNLKLDKIIDLFDNFYDYEFILPFNQTVKPQIDVLRNFRTNFKLLFDSSYGIGKSPEHWDIPVYKDIQFGYAGGLSPKNIENNLEKISKILPSEYTTWIDAEGQLRRAGSFDIELAHIYLTNALKWYKNNTK